MKLKILFSPKVRNPKSKSKKTCKMSFSFVILKKKFIGK
jgi:hypothetical protein